MRRYWFGLLLLAPACLAPRMQAAEVIASSTPRQVVASTTPAADVSSEVVPASFTPNPSRPAVLLEAPRVMRAAGASPTGLVPLPPSRLELTPLARVPAAAPAPQPTLLPDAMPVPAAEREAIASSFAVERTALFTPEPLPLPLSAGPAPTSAEKLGFMPRRQPSLAERLGFMPKHEETAAEKPTLVADAAGVTDFPAPTVDMDLGHESGPAPFRFYGGVEYLMWWVKDADIPPLVTTSTNPNPQPQQPMQPPHDFGVLGANTTAILLNNDIEHEMQSGARFRLGYWLPTCKPMAIEASFFSLGRRGDNFFAGSDGSRVISRPFFNGNQRFEDAEVLAGPGLGLGTLSISAPTSLNGWDLNLRCPLVCHDSCTGGWKLDLLGGYRALRLREGLYFTEMGMDFADLDTFRIDDRFDTQNTFRGGQLGVVGEWSRGRWSVGTRATAALGVTHEVIDVRGSAIFVDPTGAVSRNLGGLLALPSNIGHFKRDRFAVVPEVGLTLGYQVTDWMRATVGYNFLFWSNVVRPGDQVDRVLDITQIPNFNVTPIGNGQFIAPNGSVITALNPTRPVVPLKDTSFWAQGMTLGLEFRY